MPYNGFSSGYTLFSTSWWKFWLDVPRRLRSFKWLWQRMTRGWADCDTWSADAYLREVIPQMLEHLRDYMPGHPYGLTKKKWDGILTKIVEGFDAYRKINELDYKSDEEREALEKKFQAAGKLFIKWYGHFWN